MALIVKCTQTVQWKDKAVVSEVYINLDLVAVIRPDEGGSYIYFDGNTPATKVNQSPLQIWLSDAVVRK